MKLFLAASVLVSASILPAFAGNITVAGHACVTGKAPGKSFKGSNVDLPSVDKRKILGTWQHYSGLTFSLEEVSGSFYGVLRDQYCGSGADGAALRRAPNGRFYIKESRSGDYYMVLPNGSLGVFDKEGAIDTYPPHQGLYAKR
jgi:hypothetical protein